MTKNVNYTDAQVAELVEAYNMSVTDELRATTVEHYADRFGKSVASIRAKLVAEGVYIKPETSKKRGGTTKDAIASAIASVIRMSEGEADSLTKANRSALDKIWNFILDADGTVGTNARD